jgi:eukaryotic-like serine/threonine-protein kinase
MNPHDRIGDYEILGELGRGGMGRVYRVRNVISDRVEAMKVLLPNLVGQQELAERFLREIKLLAALNHPNIASLHTALTANNQLIMIMEFVEGQSLGQRLDRGAIATGDALAYVDQILCALQYAHERHVIHRDIKPANMMLTPQGVVKLMDFGIARSGQEVALTMAGATTGSLNYMSPEQVKGGPVDARSDLYSLGISLYEMVTGERPFKSKSDYALMEAHLREVPKPPSALQPGLPSDVNDIIVKAIAKDPAQRFQSAVAFRDAISQAHLVASAAVAAPSATTTDSTLSATILYEPPSASPALPVLEAPVNQKAANPRPIGESRTPSEPAGQMPRGNAPATPAPQPPPRPVKHPGLYVLLGGALVIAALVGAGLYIGRAEATPDAVRDAAPAPVPTPPAPTPTAEPADAKTPTPAAETPVPAVAPPPGPISAITPPPATDTANDKAQPVPADAGSVDARPKGSATSKASPAAGAAARSAAPPKRARASVSARDAGGAPLEVTRQEAGTPAADLAQLEHEIDQLSARVGAVDNSLTRLQREQARQGLGLRGDITARLESLRINLSRAEEAVAQRNTVRAQRYKGLAEADVEVLEKFLGR